MAQQAYGQAGKQGVDNIMSEYRWEYVGRNGKWSWKRQGAKGAILGGVNQSSGWSNNAVQKPSLESFIQQNVSPYNAAEIPCGCAI